MGTLEEVLEEAGFRLGRKYLATPRARSVRAAQRELGLAVLRCQVAHIITNLLTADINRVRYFELLE